MIYEFIDQQGTFRVKNPHEYNNYFPLTNSLGSLLSSISPNFSGDIKTDNEHFITPPASTIDLKTNLLCRRDFFIRLNNETLRLSFPWKDTLEAGFLYHKIIKENSKLRAEIINFIPHNLAVEVMWVKLINKSKSTIKIIPTSFIPLYGRAESNLRDHRHVSSLLNRITLLKYGILLKPTMVFNEAGHKLNATTYFCLGFEDKTKPPLGQFPTLEYFCQEQELINPAAVEGKVKLINKISKDFDGKEALAAFRFREKVLRKNQAVNYFLIVGAVNNSQKTIGNTFARLNTPAKVEKSLKETKDYWQKKLTAIDLNFKDNNFSNWLLWVKLQPILRKLFGNSFLPHFDYGKGGRGWRDLWQDALALLFIEPKKTKKLIVNNFKGVRIDGSNATIITKDGKMISDRNKISRVWMDHGVWPYLTLSLYLKKTNDLNILKQPVSYFKDHLFCRAKAVDKKFSQKDFILRTKDNKVYKGSVLEHLLLEHLVPFFNVGSHNIIRLENGDWNDGLDMAAQRGESVAFSFMYAHNLKSLSLLLKSLKKQKVYLLKEIFILLDQIHKPINYNNFREKQKRLQIFFQKTKTISGEKKPVALESLASDLERKAEHLSTWLRKKEWLKLGFFNGYYDNKGRRVEGKIKKSVRMMLASQVFAIMSGVASEQQIRKTYSSIKRYLKDKKLGGFRLNTDFGSSYLDLGRAFGFSYGDKENGAFFNHMAVMLSFALFQRGFSKEGRQVLDSIYKMATSKAAKIYPMIPEYFDGKARGLYLYLTGSASWYIYTLLKGIQRKD